jgi:ABC transport system ATP-binding/permease protein
VLDEPTNDLDMETLELLEEILLEFSGTLLVVSHDRKFLDNVITNCVVFEEPGVVREYVGGYQDWLDQGGKMLSFEDESALARLASATEKTAQKAALVDATTAEKKPPQANAVSTTQNKPKLSYKLERELEQLTQKIEKMDSEIAQLELRIAEPGFYDLPQNDIQSVLQKLTTLQQTLDNFYTRWDEIESTQN